MKYLALGDSYTIGEAVPQKGSFPFLLSNQLKNNGLVGFSEITVIAKTGWTTNELQKAIEGIKPSSDYDLVTLLVGVNNQYRGYPIAQFEKEFEDLLTKAIGFGKGKASHVLVVGIPDYGCTPFGSGKSEQINSELLNYNQICKDIAGKYTVEFVPVFDISKRAKKEPELIASDALHPSERMYSLWVGRLLPYVEKIVRLP